MIIQLHTPEGIINLDTEKNSEEDFAQYNLVKSDYTKLTLEERLIKLEEDVSNLKELPKIS